MLKIAAPVSLALFDLDKTLLPLDSDHAFGQFLVQIGMVDGEDFKNKNDWFYAQYLACKLDIHEYVAFSLAAIAALEPAQAAQVRQRFVDEIIRPQVLPAALDLVAKHKKNGDICLIITATNAFVTSPIAPLFGVDALLATDTEIDDSGKISAVIKGTPCYREGKITRLLAWLSAHGLRWEDVTAATFYSDSMNDVSLLEKVHHPVATNPDNALRKIALQRGWDIFQLHPHIYDSRHD